MTTTKPAATGSYTWSLQSASGSVSRVAHQIDLYVDKDPNSLHQVAFLQGKAHIVDPPYVQEELVLVFPIPPEGSFNGTIAIAPSEQSAHVYFMRGLDDVNKPIGGTAIGGQVYIQLDTAENLSGNMTGVFSPTLSFTSNFDLRQLPRKPLSKELKGLFEAFKTQ